MTPKPKMPALRVGILVAEIASGQNLHHAHKALGVPAGESDAGGWGRQRTRTKTNPGLAQGQCEGIDCDGKVRCPLRSVTRGGRCRTPFLAW